MDSNGTGFLLLASAEDFASANAGIGWDQSLGALVLAQRQRPRLPPTDPAASDLAWGKARPLVLDDHGQIGRLSPDRTRFEFAPAWTSDPNGPSSWSPVLASRLASPAAAGTAADLILDPVDAPTGTHFTDLHLGGADRPGEGLAALTYSDGNTSHGLILIHLRLRWQADCRLAEAPLRVWLDGAGRAWILGAETLTLCAGTPLAQPYGPKPDRFEPLDSNPDRLRPLWQRPLPALTQVLALCGDSERIYVLARRDDPETGTPAQVILCRRLDEPQETGFDVYPVDQKVPYATDIGALDGGRLALLAPLPDTLSADPAAVPSDCPVVELAPVSRRGPAAAVLVQERYPMRSQAAVRFVRALDGQIRYLARHGPEVLYPLPQARYPTIARATLRNALDSGEPGTLWHRIYLDACIPPGCAIAVDARVSESEDDRKAAGWDAQPIPLWTPRASELPWDAGRFDSVPGRQGLFEILLQRPNGSVRELRGRYLELRITLSGDGRHSPQVRALRLTFPRLSWQTAYLPQYLHQQELPPAATPDPEKDPQPANGADLRGRLLAALEGMLTPLEERLAAAEILLDPKAAPSGRLDGLATLVGTRLPADWPEPRRRRWLASTGRLQDRRGTMAGLTLALDIASDGAVARGQVIPVEHFRLRRTLGTILGLDLSDQEHPLTLGTGQSGNSIVGPSLILGDDDRREFLALFAPELAAGADAETLEQFFDRYARRITVVLHGPARALRRTLEQVLAEQTPAWVTWAVRESDHPFVLGLSPLLGIDTYLEPQPPAQRVVLDATPLGRGALLRNPVALSPEHVVPGRG